MNNCHVKPDYLNISDGDWIEYCTNVNNIALFDTYEFIEIFLIAMILCGFFCFFVYYYPKFKKYIKIFNKGGI